MEKCLQNQRQYVKVRFGISLAGLLSNVRFIVPYVSIDKSKSLVDKCITQYLQSRLGVCSRAREDNGLLFSPGIPHATGGAKKSTGHQNNNPRTSGARIPAVLDTIAQPGLNEFQDVFRECGLTAGLRDLSLPFHNTTFEPDTHTFNAQSTDYAVPSPTRKAPPPPIESSDRVTDSLPPNIRLLESGNPKSIFRPLENYVLACFNNCDCLNASFLTPRPSQPARAASEGANVITSPRKSADWRCPEESLPGIDAKTLLLGDFAENGMWWTGRSPVERHRAHRYGVNSPEESPDERVSLKTPRINWDELSDWYHLILSTGQSWQGRWQQLQASSGFSSKDSSANDFREIQDDMTKASEHLQRTLLKATESLLRRPGRPLKTPEDCRFLFILLANPTFYPSGSPHSETAAPPKMQRSVSHDETTTLHVPSLSPRPKTASSRRLSDTNTGSAGKHSGIVKRILGLMSNTSLDCNHYFVVWFSRLSEAHFRKLVDLVGSFVTYRLTRQHGRKHSNGHNLDSGLIPSIVGPGAGSSAQLHAALGVAGTSKASEKHKNSVVYGEDWQIKAAARVMSLLFSANNGGVNSRHEAVRASLSNPATLGSVARQRAHSHGQILPTSSFYNSLLDYSDLIADFEIWESRRGKFSFCQYPMFLSMWAKIHIMEYDARRQMEIKAREAFFTSIMNRKAVSQHLVLKVRRECLVEDSLRGVSESVGTGQDEIKKGLRIEFSGEEGVDAGG